jgi:hypothetical protein
MPAVSWPSEAIFSDWISRSWARRQFLKQPRILDGEHSLPGKGLQ